MSYLIYDQKTGRIKGKVEGYKTVAAATAQITRWSKIWFRERYTPLYPAVDRGEDPVFQYAIALADIFYRDIEPKVLRRNLMTGAEYEEPVNTPLYMSPASETYWSR
jgi:hypothetical protein